MLSRSTIDPARKTRLRRFAPLALGLGVVLGAATLTGAMTAPSLVQASEAGSAMVLASSMVTTGEGMGNPQTLSEITADSNGALRDARAIVESAATLEAEVAAAGLDLGGASTDIDTTDLGEYIDRLDDSTVLPILMLPPLTEETAAETARVKILVASLHERFAAAQAQRAAEEAAAAAQRAAEEAAAQAQREAEAAAAALANANTVDGAKATAQQKASAEYGWGSDQFSCLVSLWNKESGWNYQAYNAGSGATGIPQALPGSKMASAGSDWQSSASTQISWGLRYIASVYGTPCSAWGHSQSTGWY
jgi:hypothetical protein